MFFAILMLIVFIASAITLFCITHKRYRKWVRSTPSDWQQNIVFMRYGEVRKLTSQNHEKIRVFRSGKCGVGELFCTTAEPPLSWRFGRYSRLPDGVYQIKMPYFSWVVCCINVFFDNMKESNMAAKELYRQRKERKEIIMSSFSPHPARNDDSDETDEEIGVARTPISKFIGR